MLLAVCFLCGMGVWQLQRMSWKETMIVQYQQAQTQEAALLSSLSSAELLAMPYRPVIATGQFMHEHEFHLGGRRYYGKTGYHLLTPFRLNDGRVILVNRGWVPTEFKEISTRAQSLIEGEHTVRGMVKQPKEAGMFTPANHPEKNFWFTVDMPAMQAQANEPLLPVILEVVDPDNPRTQFPAPSTGEVVFRNDHLGYAITWFSLALAALVIYWLRFVRRAFNV